MRWLTLVLLTCLTPAMSMAQARDSGAVWLRWRDSLAALSPSEVVALTATADTLAGSPSDRLLRHAFVTLRAGEISQERVFLDEALAGFCRVTPARKDWWLPWFGVGLAQGLLAKGRYPVRPAECHTEGTSYTQDAGLAFARALEANPRSTEAATALADVVVNDPGWGLGSVARKALRQFGSGGAPQPPGVLLVRAELERNGGDRDSVLPLLGQYLAAGGDSGVGLLQSARERFFRGDSAAARDYWAGVHQARSGPARAMLLDQLAQIARPGEMHDFSDLTGDSLVQWVKAFWTRRDVQAGVSSGERLAEHYRRYEVAWRGFRPISLGLGGTTVTAAYRMSRAILNAASDSPGDSGVSPRAPETSDLTPTSLFGDESLLLQPNSRSDGFDVRGQVYLRHGPPDDMAGPLWVYRRGGREYLIRVNGYYPGTPCNLAPKYCKYEMAGRRTPPEVQHKWEREWGEMFADLRRFDSEIRHFPHDLEVAARLYTFPKTEALGGELIAAFAIPADRLQAIQTPAGQAYRIHLHLIISPPSGDFRLDRDTTRTFVVSKPLGPGTFLQAVEPLSLDPGRYVARLIIGSPDSSTGTLLAADSLEIGDGAASLVLSDLIFSRDSTSLVRYRGDERVPIDPLGTASRRESLSLYYELAGLTPGREYRTSVEIIKGAPGKSRPDLYFGFGDHAVRPTIQVHRQFGISRLKPGKYVIQVTVLSAGRRVIRRAPLVVTE